MNSLSNIDYSSPAFIISVVVVVVLIAAAIAVVVHLEKVKTAKLRNRFGTEYDLAVSEAGSRKKAEEALHARCKRIEHLKIRDLTVAERQRYLVEWETVQSRVLDHPRGAVTEADELVSSLLQARGYPVSGFEQSAEDVSVNYPRMMEYYRSAHAVAVRPGKMEASTEELRSAMIDYRTLFDELVQVQTPAEQRSAS